MASNRSLFCLALLAICFVASGGAAVLDSGSNGSCQLMLRGGGGCLPCKHWTNAPSVVTWFSGNKAKHAPPASKQAEPKKNGHPNPLRFLARLMEKLKKK
jgi:hypothetical protein